MNSVAVLDIVILLLLATLCTGHLTQVNLIAPGSDTHCWLGLVNGYIIYTPVRPHTSVEVKASCKPITFTNRVVGST